MAQKETTGEEMSMQGMMPLHSIPPPPLPPPPDYVPDKRMDVRHEPGQPGTGELLIIFCIFCTILWHFEI